MLKKALNDRKSIDLINDNNLLHKIEQCISVWKEMWHGIEVVEGEEWVGQLSLPLWESLVRANSPGGNGDQQSFPRDQSLLHPCVNCLNQDDIVTRDYDSRLGR